MGNTQSKLFTRKHKSAPKETMNSVLLNDAIYVDELDKLYKCIDHELENITQLCTRYKLPKEELMLTDKQRRALTHTNNIPYDERLRLLKEISALLAPPSYRSFN